MEYIEALRKAIIRTKDYGHKTYSNAIIGTEEGTLISLNDVSPLEHKVTVKVNYKSEYSGESEIIKICGKNIFDAVNAKKVSGNVGYENQNGVMTIKASYALNYVAANLALPNTLVGKTVTISTDVETSGNNTGGIRVEWMSADGVALTPYMNIAKYSTGSKTRISATGIITSMPNDEAQLCLLLYANSTGSAVLGDTATYSNIQVEVNDIETEYAPYTEYESITTTVPSDIELTSVAPNMTVFTENQGVTLSAKYNKDINKVIEKITQAIISMGGNIDV